uniref:Uncharacterized protein n=1 Tax=Pediastrum angulosum TaxID=271408 RepID=A0A2U8GHV4_9CHLO|nr:hypothetical protein [Pediastrum angulosum]
MTIFKPLGGLNKKNPKIKKDSRINSDSNFLILYSILFQYLNFLEFSLLSVLRLLAERRTRCRRSRRSSAECFSIAEHTVSDLIALLVALSSLWSRVLRSARSRSTEEPMRRSRSTEAPNQRTTSSSHWLLCLLA